MSIDVNLKRLRLQKKLTQGQLAEMASIELTQVSRIERNASEPKLETIKKLAIALECSTDQLIMNEATNKHDPNYIKDVVKKINNLTPVKKFVILEILESYLKQNEIKEPSIREQFAQSLSDNDCARIAYEHTQQEIHFEEELIDDLHKELIKIKKEMEHE